ncbi:MAG: hypothetical protein NTY86_07120 [Deltaproteobacteria bacterium]|nr:hypothetical protein [Deltaproteobacteria bacterium]
MNSKLPSQVTVFWSWQNDSPPKENRNFIEDCLRRATKKIGREDAIIIEVDRDTKGLGGTPAIAEAILTKIRASDVFVWDATLIYSKPRPAPNPNVLLELGYALAVMGEGRLVGVMNIAGCPGGENLPFDLKHRRWPTSYFLPTPSVLRRLIEKVVPSIRRADQEYRRVERENLVNNLAVALRAALNEPKSGALLSDVDFYVAKALWQIIDSPWLTYWCNWRLSNPQHERSENSDRILKYLDVVGQPENAFHSGPLKDAHDKFLSSLKAYAFTAAIEMVPDGPKAFVISVKKSSLGKEDYDEKYDRQVNALLEKIENLWEEWKSYIEQLRLRYPEITATVEHA